MKGNKTWIKKELPLYRRKAKKVKDPKSKAQLEEKINKIFEFQMNAVKSKSKKLKQVCLIFDDIID